MVNSIIPAIAAFAANPVDKVNRFKIIDPHQEYHYSVRYPYLIAGIGLAVVSYLVFRENKYIWGIPAGLSAFSFTKSIDWKLVNKEAYSDQVRDINGLFDPYIDCFKAQFQAKANGIHRAVNDLELSSFDDVKATIEKVAAVYDKTADGSTWNKRPVDTHQVGDKEYSALKAAAHNLTAFSLEKLEGLDPIVKRKMSSLQQAARAFLNGVKVSTEKGQDAYVGYGWSEGRAIISVRLPNFI